MGATMAVIMLGYMLSMYSSHAINSAKFLDSVIVFAASLRLDRSQETVQDRSFMSEMIPHHSIAIMTCSRAELLDARAEKLAHEIVLAQNREISEMRHLVAHVGAPGETDEIYEDPPAEVSTLEEALNSTHIATLDPSPLALSGLPERVETGALDCGFRRVEDEVPVLWTNDQGALMRLNGVLERQEAEAGRIWGAPGVTMTVRNLEEADWRGGAELIFALEQGLTVGYRSFYDCA